MAHSADQHSDPTQSYDRLWGERKANTMTRDDCILQMARTIWKAEHPRKSWIAYPNTTQSTVQARYISTATACFNIAHWYVEPDAKTLGELDKSEPGWDHFDKTPVDPTVLAAGRPLVTKTRR
jgi:hypothetical protein